MKTRTKRRKLRPSLLSISASRVAKVSIGVRVQVATTSIECKKLSTGANGPKDAASFLLSAQF